jgi:hypothetical protein
MLAIILAFLLATDPTPPHPLTTRATRYADTARDEGGTPACKHHLPHATYDALHSYRVAHRTLPCGTLLVVQAGERRMIGAVLDRGPWNRQILHGSAQAKRKGVRMTANPSWSRTQLLRAAGARSGPGWAWRGDLDLSPIPASALGLTLHVGRLHVRYWPLRWQPFIREKRSPVGQPAAPSSLRLHSRRLSS